MKKLVMALVAAFSLTANAQNVGTLSPNVDANVFYSWDSDKFNVLHSWVGASHESGFGARIGYSEYDGKYDLGYGSIRDYITDTEIAYVLNTANATKFNATSNVFQLTYVTVGEKHKFQGAIGVRNTDYSAITDPNKLDLVWSGAPIPLSSIDFKWMDKDGSHETLVANADLRLTMTDRLTIGASVATDLVETPASIVEGVRSIYTAMDADYTITENLSVNVIVGNTHFTGEPDGSTTNNNNRLFIRTNTSWAIIPEYGISVNLRTRNQQDSNAGSIYYFSPERLARQTIGTKLRKNYSGLVYTAAIEGGSEQVVSAFGTKDTHPVYGWQLGVQTSPRKKEGTTFGASLVGSNASGSNGGGEDYNWYGLNLWLKSPL